MRAAFDTFLRDDRGSLYLIGTILAPLLMLLSGAAIDYSTAHSARKAVQHAADTAALAMAQAQVLEKSDVRRQGDRFIEANTSHIRGVDIKDVTITVHGRGHVTIKIDAHVDTIVMGLVSADEFNFTVLSEARFDDPDDIDFTVLIDRSPSMLLGATLEDMDRIGEINATLKHGRECGFACHYTGVDSYTLSRGQGIDTRLDVAKKAVTAAFEIGAEASEKSGGEVHGHVYTFTTGLEPVATGLVDAVLGSRKIGTIQPDDSHSVSGDKYAQTAFAIAMNAMTAELEEKRRRNKERQAFFLIITDGVDDYRQGRRIIAPMSPEECAKIKRAGVTVSVIYTTYFPLYYNSFYNNNVRPFEDEIAPSLQGCATPGWFFEAQYGDDIEKAMTEVMRMALPRPRLTQ